MSLLTTASANGVELWRFQKEGRPEQLTKLSSLGPKSMRHFKWDKAGERIAVWDEELVKILQVSEEGQVIELMELKTTTDIEGVDFSPARWVGIKLDKQSENFFLGDHRSCKWLSPATIRARYNEEAGPPWHFHSDDYLCVLTPEGQVKIVDLNQEDANADLTAQIQQRSYLVGGDVTDFAVGPLRTNPKVIVVAIFRRATENKTATISITYVDAEAQRQDAVVSDAPLGMATEVELKWNKIGSVILIKESAAVDKTGSSYYGSSQLYSLRTAKNAELKTVVSHKDGSVQFYGWSSIEREMFFVGYGPLPCKIEMWSAAKHAPKLDLGQARRNYLAVANPTQVQQPDETPPNLVLIGGFGNLPGDVDIWNLKAGRITGLAKLPWTVEIEFSPDNLWLLASTTTPRLRVDNCLKIVCFNGEQVLTQNFAELYQAKWRPRPETVSLAFDHEMKPHKSTSANTAGTGLTLRKKGGGGFGGALSAALTRSTPASLDEASRVAIRSGEKKAQAAEIPGYSEPSIPGAPVEDSSRSKNTSSRKRAFL